MEDGTKLTRECEFVEKPSVMATTGARAVDRQLDSSNEAAVFRRVEIMSPKANQFGVWGEGFTPNETVNFTSASEGEVRENNTHASAGGMFLSIVTPAVVGKESGIASATAAGRA